jgi:hypothetical protein
MTTQPIIDLTNDLRPMDVFEQMPDSSMDQPFSTEQERETLEEDSWFDTAYNPPTSLLYPSDIADPVPGIYKSEPMSYVEEKTVAKREVDHGSDCCFRISKRLKETPGWKCDSCGTMNSEETYSCFEYGGYNKGKPNRTAWGRMCADQKKKRTCRLCLFLDELSGEQCKACGNWLCPSCGNQRTMDQGTFQHRSAEKPSCITAKGIDSKSETAAGSTTEHLLG